jgi:hypothetical protein
VFFTCLFSLKSFGQDAKATTLESKRLLLSVGISEFNDSLWHPLKYAGKDAKDIHDALTNLNKPFEADGLRIGQDEKVLRLRDLRKAMRDFKITNQNPDDTVIVYFSSHGTVAYKKDGSLGRYIITSDTDRSDLSQTALDYDELITWFNGLRSEKKVLILAFCHSGVGKSALTPQMKRALSMLKSPYFEEPVQERSQGSIILTASGWREPALEDPALQNDVYTHFLLEGLDQDLNQDGAVSITEAHQYAAQATYKYTRGRQRPSAILELLGSDPILIKGEIRSRRFASLYSLVGRLSDLMVSVDGNEEQSLEKGILIPEGKVRLTVKDPKSQTIISDRVVQLEGGREYAIDSFLAPSLPNSFVFGLTQFYMLNDSIRRSYVTTDSLGYRAAYRREQVLGVMGAEFAVSYFPSMRESFDVDQNRFNQSRQLLSGDLVFTVSEKLRNISAGDGSRIYEWRLLGGLTGLIVERKIDASGFIRPKEKTFSPGLKMGVGLDVTLPYYLLKVSAGADMAALQNIAQTGPAVMLGASFNLGVGTYW